MNGNSGWYGARTLYRTFVEGAPGSSVVEQRVILVKVADADAAIEAAEADAIYCSSQWINHDGKRVLRRYLAVCDVFGISSEPGHGTEVYSALVDVHEETDEELVMRFFGEDDVDLTTRAKVEPNFDKLRRGTRGG